MKINKSIISDHYPVLKLCTCNSDQKEHKTEKMCVRVGGGGGGGGY